MVRAGQQTPPSEVMRQALYDVIRHCLYGVDIDASPAWSCVASVWRWMRWHQGATFFCLDHHIQWGDSLLGATPALLAQGIPDAAFTPIAGDDKTVAAALRKRNQDERLGQMALTFPTAQAAPVPAATASASARGCLVCRVSLAEDAGGTASSHPRHLALGCTWLQSAYQPPRKRPSHVSPPSIMCCTGTWPFRKCLLSLRLLNCPENAMAGWHGGFDVVLGKPPWQPLTARAQMERTIPLLRHIRRQRTAPLPRPYSLPVLFLETARLLIRPTGRIGCLIPAPLVTTETAFFQTLLAQGALVSLHTITNDTRLMSHLPRTMALSLLTLAGQHAPRTAADVVWGVRQLDELDDATRHVRLKC